ncbi:hypothetical protein LZC95_12930 [Pendulispora brunnea]|uniref:Uncharacterized protein n=1 Tax=Pendulispora brunnea TaxID=2905690 RepID=A0ABZ2KJI7_9BACT
MGLTRGLAPAIVATALLGAVLVPACGSLGDGEGSIGGTLNVPNCWSGDFRLAPDFYAGVPYRDSVQLRIQHGGDFETFSDGIMILVDDVHAIRGDNGLPSRLGQPLKVSLPVGVFPPGVPITPDPDPGLVHLTLYLQRTCRTQNVALHAVSAASLNANGTCDAIDSGEPFIGPCQGSASPPGADAGAGGDAGADGGDGGTSTPPRVGYSTITFDHLYNAVPEETNAAQRLSEGRFDVYLVDPREICPGGLGPPPRCRGHLTGNFRFYFERGRPGQPFP